MRDMGLEYIPKSAIRFRKYNMRRGLFMGQNVSVQMLAERVNEFNRYLPYLKEEYPKTVGSR